MESIFSHCHNLLTTPLNIFNAKSYVFDFVVFVACVWGTRRTWKLVFRNSTDRIDTDSCELTKNDSDSFCQFDISDGLEYLILLLFSWSERQKIIISYGHLIDSVWGIFFLSTLQSKKHTVKNCMFTIKIFTVITTDGWWVNYILGFPVNTHAFISYKLIFDINCLINVIRQLH